MVIAKRKGADWFLGAMTNDAEREFTLKTDFLGGGRHRVEIWSDVDASKPNLLNRTQTFIKSGETMNLALASGGGQVLKFTPIDP